MSNKFKQLKALRDILISQVREMQTLSENPALETNSTKKLEFKLQGAQFMSSLWKHIRA